MNRGLTDSTHMTGIQPPSQGVACLNYGGFLGGWPYDMNDGMAGGGEDGSPHQWSWKWTRDRQGRGGRCR